MPSRRHGAWFVGRLAPRGDATMKVLDRTDGQMLAGEILNRAGLDWTVSRRAMFLQGGEPVPNSHAIARDDNNRVVGVVGNRYTAIQNVEALKVLDGVVGSGEAVYANAGMFDGGSKVFLQAKLPGS